MDNTTASQHRHDSENASSDSDKDQMCIDTDDFADFVWLKGSRYSYTQTLDPSLNDPDLEKRYNLHPRRQQPRNGYQEGQKDRSLIDERAGEPGYQPKGVEEWAAGVAAAANNNAASHNQQLRERTARLRSRERAAIDATVTTLERSQNAVPGPTSPSSAAAGETLCSLVESNSENVLVMYTASKCSPRVVCQYPLCPRPNRDISEAGSSYVSLEHLGDWKDLTAAPGIEVRGDDGVTKLIPVFVRAGRDESLHVHGTFCVACLKELCLWHV
ncbi:uncharacterized protein J3D65DRAFT_669071 [Phyllosticta citribraziliensis]|uniref:Uncharacterized protein n=1 Tax=Phyllosticta citribraziliensis TaxID=989973 RepID=A0ABR1LID7_9PEZI